MRNPRSGSKSVRAFTRGAVARLFAATLTSCAGAASASPGMAAAVGVAFGAVLAAPAATAGEVTSGFQALSFEEALAAAKKADKVVFVDFFTTWCGPCKMLDRSTFKDEEVVKFLSEKTIAIKIDCEQQKELAGRLRVSAYPTMGFYKPDGTEIGRIVGYRDAKRFLDEAIGMASGISPLERLKREVAEGTADDPEKRTRLAELYLEAGQVKDAANELIWVYENTRTVPGWTEIRNGVLLQRLGLIANNHADVRTKMLAVRDRAKATLIERPGDVEAAKDFVSISTQFDDPDEIVAVFPKKPGEAAPADGGFSIDAFTPEVKRVFRDAAIDRLLAMGRYDAILITDPIEDVAYETRRLKQLQGFAQRDPRGVEIVKQRLLLRWAKVFQAVAASRPPEQAEALARAIFGVDRSSRTVDWLRNAAKDAGKAEYADRITAIAKEFQSPEDGAKQP
jgi:thioredoxin-like negative regulator of GroEL